MDNENINNIVNSAYESDAAGVRDALYNAINDKIFDALEQRKQQIATNLVAAHNQAEEEDTEEDEVEDTEEETEE
jgi:hypothetical protein